MSDKVETVALEKADFEKRFLALVYQSEVLITPANVAYHLDVPIEETTDQLLSLELNGVIQQKIDDDGNTYYVMPNRPAPGTKRLGTEEGSDAPDLNTSNNPADIPTAPNLVSPGVPAKNIYGMLLNFFIPGVGSLVAGKKIGAVMLAMVLLGMLMLILLPWKWGLLLGVAPMGIGVIWSWIAGVMLMFDNKR